MQALHKVSVPIEEAGQGQDAKCGVPVHAVEHPVVRGVGPQGAQTPAHHRIKGALLRGVAAAPQGCIPAAEKLLGAWRAPEVQDPCSMMMGMQSTLHDSKGSQKTQLCKYGWQVLQQCSEEITQFSQVLIKVPVHISSTMQDYTSAPE